MTWARPANIFCALAVLIAPVALFAPKGLVPLTVLAALALAANRDVRRQFAKRLCTPLWITLAAILLWALIGVLWAPDAEQSLSLWFALLGLFAAGLAVVAGADAVNSADRDRVGRALVAGLGIFLVLAVVEVVSGRVLTTLVREGSGPEVLNRGAAVLAILMWPAALAAARIRNALFAGVLIVIALAVLLFLPMFAALIAALAGAVAFVAIFWMPRGAILALAAVPLVLLVLMPVLSFAVVTPDAMLAWVPDLPDSWLHRFYIWEFASTRIAEAPLAGWGLDASRSIQGGAAQVTDRIAIQAQALPLHPHSGAIQIWLELGLPGTLLAGAALAAVLRAIAGAAVPAASRAAAAGAFASWFVLFMLSFGVWQNWWLCVPFLIAGLWSAAASHSSGARVIS